MKKLYPAIIIFWVNSFWLQSNSFLPLQGEPTHKSLFIGLIFVILTILTAVKVIYDMFFEFLHEVVCSDGHVYSSHVTVLEWEGPKRIFMCSVCGHRKEEVVQSE